MPRGLVWSITWLMVFGMIITPIIYFSAMANDPVVENSISPDADSWGIPIGGSIVLTLILLPVILGVTAICTRRYTSPKLLVWRRDRPIRSILATVVFAIVIGPVLGLCAADFLASPPPYEYDIVPVVALGVLWVAMLRASAITMGDKALSISEPGVG